MSPTISLSWSNSGTRGEGAAGGDPQLLSRDVAVPAEDRLSITAGLGAAISDEGDCPQPEKGLVEGSGWRKLVSRALRQQVTIALADV